MILQISYVDDLNLSLEFISTSSDSSIDISTFSRLDITVFTSTHEGISPQFTLGKNNITSDGIHISSDIWLTLPKGLVSLFIRYAITSTDYSDGASDRTITWHSNYYLSDGGESSSTDDGSSSTNTSTITPSTSQWGKIIGDITDLTDLVDYVNIKMQQTLIATPEGAELYISKAVFTMNYPENYFTNTENLSYSFFQAADTLTTNYYMYYGSTIDVSNTGYRQESVGVLWWNFLACWNDTDTDKYLCLPKYKFTLPIPSGINDPSVGASFNKWNAPIFSSVGATHWGWEPDQNNITTDIGHMVTFPYTWTAGIRKSTTKTGSDVEDFYYGIKATDAIEKHICINLLLPIQDTPNNRNIIKHLLYQEDDAFDTETTSGITREWKFYYSPQVS